MKTRYMNSLASGVILLGLGLASVAHATSIPGQGTWETALEGRDLDGDRTTAEAFYDRSLRITWLADANYAMTSRFDADGLMTWVDASAWADGLNPYGSGIMDWWLPWTSSDSETGCRNSGINCGYNVDPYTSALAHLFWVTLGNESNDPFCNEDFQIFCGSGLTNTGPFDNVRSGLYWSSEEYIESPFERVWGFTFGDGFQSSFDKSGSGYSWAVHSGDVGASLVPVPAAGWLFGSGLLGLLGMRGRRRRS